MKPDGASRGPDADDLGVSHPRFVVGVGLAGKIEMREIGFLELLPADEVQIVLVPRAGVPVRNQQMDLRVLSIAHPVHPGDLAPQKVEVAVVAVEEYTKRPIGLLWRRLYGRILRERE